MIINKIANIDKYPIPITEDLLVKMNGGRVFCKLHLSNVYQQLVLDRKSREYLTINMQKRLYQLTRLKFRNHSATDIFQRAREKCLGYIPRLTAQVDDILIAREDCKN